MAEFLTPPKGDATTVNVWDVDDKNMNFVWKTRLPGWSLEGVVKP